MAFKTLRFASMSMKNSMGGAFMKAALAAIALVPCLYGALYLAAFMDPFNTLDDVPVAVVNLDEGAEVSGEERNVGEEVCDDMAGRSDGMQWNFVSADEAREGMEAGKYYMTCTIPADFSERIASADTGESKAARLGIEYNESKNVLASKIGQTVWQRLQAQVDESVARRYWEAALDTTDEAGSGLESASQGASQLAQGVEAAQEGNDAIVQGLSGLSQGAGALRSGLDALASGGAALGEGMSALSATGDALGTGADTLAAGLSAVGEQTAALPEQANAMAQGASAVGEGLGAAVGAIGSSDAPGASLAYASKSVTDGLAALKGSLDSMDESLIPPLTEGLADVSERAASAQAAMAAAQGALPDASALEGALSAARSDAAQLEGALVKAYDRLAASENADDRALAAEIAACAVSAQAGELSAALANAQGSLPDSSEASARLAAASESLSVVQSAIGDSDDAPESTTLFAAANALSEKISASSQTVGSATIPGKTLAFASNGVTQGLDGLAEGLVAAQSGAQALSGGASALAQAAPALSEGLGQLGQGASALSSGVQAYAGGVGVIAQNVPAFVQGASAAAQGTSALVSGADALAQGSTQMGDALSMVAEGNQSLADQLSEGVGNMRMPAAQREAKAEMMAAPVALDETYYAEVDNYGTGFAPYFMALGLWVGCLVAGFAIRPLDSRLVASGANPFVAAFAGFVPLAAFAIVQALILLAVLQFGLGLQIENVPQFYGFGLLVAVAFAAIMQMLTAALGFPGRFVSVVLLMLQLTSCAGTFPIETAPAFFQAISPLMPMTYAVEGMRQIMTGIGFDLASRDVLVLAAVGIACLLLTALAAYRKRTVRMERLHPVFQLG